MIAIMSCLLLAQSLDQGAVDIVFAFVVIIKYSKYVQQG